MLRIESGGMMGMRRGHMAFEGAVWLFLCVLGQERKQTPHGEYTPTIMKR